MAGKLDIYRGMRDFSRTPEPAGAVGGAEGERRFVVQRHRASRLHYDVRFEIDGVLVSWAVPKGPTLDPKARRLAMHVEDHPVEYLHFEGVIPSGEYGGGDVIVWDTGTWEPVHTDDPGAAVRDGELHAEMHGHKLRGRLVLVRRDDRGGAGSDEWMLLHKHDDHAVGGWDPEEHPRSVLSGRTNEEVVEDPHRIWRSEAPAAEASVSLLPESLPAEAIDELESLGSGGTWEVFGRRLKVTNLDKVLFPADDRGRSVTKRELLAYTARVAPVALPYLAGRPLNMHRYPNGVGGKGFWHKQRPEHAPGWLRCWENPDADEGETTAYVVPDEPAALVWVANFGALEWHPWTSRAESPHEPTYALIDLDPGERTTWDDLLALARLHRTALDHLGVTARPKVTGRRGIQIWVPVTPGYTFEDTRAWVEKVSRTVGKVVPELISWKWEVKQRKGLARLDYTQNAINKTLVAPYSARPAAGAPVSVPIAWSELDDPGLRTDRWTIRTVLDRLVERGDPFRALLGAAQELPEIS
ncbi:DNA polymerase ligase N-terminal domain-containing protein [Nocardioides sp. YIM 152315]|uniref:non-homologous end-joining DNA ligase LigD n=1 Tax=Nocardioides sp. YIM 152315 TaxID=3031760 RepID=UPI0023D9C307|nr:DNA polymerase ligase N-terminal domain-containing protein [Nocardioides sp. YIM 152315]MDF1601921.1 DNA polymerase ligase N-terminal domain-containing protein [Nocardioides sp. YIM 152315]